jgi:hypothetical protein
MQNIPKIYPAPHDAKKLKTRFFIFYIIGPPLPSSPPLSDGIITTFLIDIILFFKTFIYYNNKINWFAVQDRGEIRKMMSSSSVLSTEECMDIILSAGLLSRNLQLSRPSSKVLKGSISSSSISENIAAILLEDKDTTCDSMSITLSIGDQTDVDFISSLKEIVSTSSKLIDTSLRATSDEAFTACSASLKTEQAVNTLLSAGTSSDEMKAAEILLRNLELASYRGTTTSSDVHWGVAGRVLFSFQFLLPIYCSKTALPFPHN